MKEMLLIIKALSDKTRLRILKILASGERCVCDLSAALAMVQPHVSFHLTVLRRAGLIKNRKCGRWTYSSIDETDMFRRFMVLTTLEKIADKDIAPDRKRLEAYLKDKERRAC